MEVVRKKRCFSLASIGGAFACTVLLGLSIIYLYRAYQIKTAGLRHNARMEHVTNEKVKEKVNDNDDWMVEDAGIVNEFAAKSTKKIRFDGHATVTSQSRQGAECATLVSAFQKPGSDDREMNGRGLKFVYSPISSTCFCSSGELDLDKVTTMIDTSADAARVMAETNLFIYRFRSCEDVGKANIYAALFNSLLAACWITFFYIKRRRKRLLNWQFRPGRFKQALPLPCDRTMESKPQSVTCNCCVP